MRLLFVAIVAFVLVGLGYCIAIGVLQR